MAINMAQKRGRKAQRRKQQVALKRRADALEVSLPAQIARAARTPVQHCYLTEAIFECGMGTLVLARGGTRQHLTMCAFLLDTYCLGIKDVMIDSVDDGAFEHYMHVSSIGSPMIPVDPAYARKLLRDLAAWSRSFGFAPHRDFAVAERLFGEVNADDSDAVFEFGLEDEAVYMPGPGESSATILRRAEQLQKALGHGQGVAADTDTDADPAGRIKAA